LAGQFSTPDDVFADIDARLREGINSLAGTAAKYMFELSGLGGGRFHVIVSEGHGSAGAGRLDDPDLTFAISAEDFMAITREEMDSVLAFMNGKITMRGDQRLAFALAPVWHPEIDWNLSSAEGD
jgi:putative sterol carrier protein